MTGSSDSKGPLTRFFEACALFAGGVILVYIALGFLARVWIWLAAVGVVAAAIAVLLAWLRRRSGRW